MYHTRIKHESRYRWNWIYCGSNDKCYERFRHRYGFSKKYTSDFENHGVVFSGIGDNDIIEAMELSDKKWFIGVQYHPEFNSTPLNPSPLFKSFISAIISK